jgi:hypothetical protein
MKIIVAGSRTFSDYNCLKNYFMSFINTVPMEGDISLISGGCSDVRFGFHTHTRKDGTKIYGADGLAERLAEDLNYTIKTFDANWELYGKAAGPIRNTAMAKEATHCICFWNGLGTGTADMIKKAKSYKLKLMVVLIKKTSEIIVYP